MRSGYLSEIFASFQGEGAHVGFRHLFVRLAGCNLRCRYCDTPDSLERSPAYMVFSSGTPPQLRPNPVTPTDLANLLTRLLEHEHPIDALALTGGEPLAQSDFLATALRIGAFGVPVLLETNGILPQRLRELLPYVQIISMDLKLPSNTSEGAFWAEHAEFLELARSKDLYVKILVDETTFEEDVGRAAGLVSAIAPAAPAFMQPIVDATGKPLITGETLKSLYVTARRHMASIRVLPQTHKLLGIQ